MTIYALICAIYIGDDCAHAVWVAKELPGWQWQKCREILPAEIRGAALVCIKTGSAGA